MSNPNPQPVALAAWENVTLTVTMASNGSISGQHYQLNIRDQNKNIVYTTLTFAVVDAGSSTTPGVFSFDLISATTGGIDVSDYKYDVWRIDSGSEKRLVWGPLSVLEEQWR